MNKFLVLTILTTYKNISFIFNSLNQNASLFESLPMIEEDYK